MTLSATPFPRLRVLAAQLLAVGLSAAPLVPACAGGATDVYTVANYPVEARAQDSLTAKQQALTAGQQDALRSLMRRLVPVTAFQRLKSLPPLNAADFINGVSVRSERTSATEYIATLDFSFQPAAVRDTLVRNGIPFVDSQAQQTVVIPLWHAKAGDEFVSGKGAWYDYWVSLDLDHTLAPLKLASLKPGISADQVLAVAANPDRLSQVFSGEYRTDRLVLAIAEPDPSGAKLIVTMAGADAAGSFSLRRPYRIASGDVAYTQELAAVISQGILEGRWKAVKAGAVGGVDASGDQGLQIVAEFETLSEWNDIRAKILDTDGAFDVAIGSVSARAAEVTLRHNGSMEGLAQAFAAHGLTLDNVGGTWRVRSTF